MTLTTVTAAVEHREDDRPNVQTLGFAVATIGSPVEAEGKAVGGRLGLGELPGSLWGDHADHGGRL